MNTSGAGTQERKKIMILISPREKEVIKSILDELKDEDTCLAISSECYGRDFNYFEENLIEDILREYLDGE